MFKLIAVPTTLNIIDNTHVKFVKCLKVIRKKYGIPGSIMVTVIKQMGKHKKLKIGQIHRVLILRISSPSKIYQHTNGFWYYFKDNGAIILNKDGLPMGKRFKGPLSLQFRKRKFLKIISKKNEMLI